MRNDIQVIFKSTLFRWFLYLPQIHMLCFVYYFCSKTNVIIHFGQTIFPKCPTIFFWKPWVWGPIKKQHCKVGTQILEVLGMTCLRNLKLQIMTPVILNSVTNKFRVNSAISWWLTSCMCHISVADRMDVSWAQDCAKLVSLQCMVIPPHNFFRYSLTHKIHRKLSLILSGLLSTSLPTQVIWMQIKCLHPQRCPSFETHYAHAPVHCGMGLNSIRYHLNKQQKAFTFYW